jgi:hypothetical protein
MHHGWQVREQRFRFTTGLLSAFPLLGAGLGWLALAELPLLLLDRVPGWLALIAAVLGLAALAGIAAAVVMGAALPGETREDANLIATRGGAAPRRWLVAHLDTKAQQQSMAGRLVAVWCVLAAVVGLVGAAVARLVAGPLGGAAAGGVAALAILAGFLAGRGKLAGQSPGARDNASGLLAVLTAAERNSSADLGILITSAEEFGMVGARIFARLDREMVAGTEVVNCDTLDQSGTLYVVTHDARADGLVRKMVESLGLLGLQVRARRLPLGILVDSLPLARAGAAAITLGRLDWATLRRIHTPRDTGHDLDWSTAERVGEALARSD